MKSRLLLWASFSLLAIPGCTQNNPKTKPTSANSNLQVGGRCEGCEAIHESPVPFEKLDNMVWLPDWKEKERVPTIKGIKLAVNGIVYKADGKTPAPGVILYIYHTDQNGIYPTKGDEKGWAKQHGYLRGWMKTNEKGEYKFFTLKPAAYPGGQAAAHIHIIVKEPDKNAYSIDEFVFDDDPLLTKEDRSQQRNRGGSGLLKFRPYYIGKDFIKSERHIYLGKNIQNYQ